MNPQALWRTVGAALGTSKINQKSIKMHQKSSKNILHSGLGPQEAPRGPKTLPRPFQARKQGAMDLPPGHHFGRILVPCWPQEPLKGHSKYIQNFD